MVKTSSISQVNGLYLKGTNLLMNMISEDLFDDVQVRHTTCVHGQDLKTFGPGI